MPKEVIAYAAPVERPSWDAEGVKTGSVMCTDPRLTLHWSALNSSELDLHGGVSLSIASYPVLTVEEYAELKCWPPEPEFEQHTAPLDREAINKLIRLLRKARDVAYGRDE
jgi:hypothetical protein